ncbi:DUF1491 family protein [Elioraea tepidiphila]|jgi:hypothetical protein|uniref:DUF1491 family protein n=1 Tax=Elioraea tepidiphila TaxID=457934 RepID=UPI00037FFF6B|nr:DUF1491 family protein [Elioraea tepidiphila]
MEARLKSGLWVRAVIRQCDRMGRAAVVLRKGDPDSGGILVVLRGQAGSTVLAEARDAEGRPAWVRGTGEAPADQAGVDAYLARQVKRDPDVWVIEIDAPDLVPPFEARLV